jgi:hypothetical protein
MTGGYMDVKRSKLDLVRKLKKSEEERKKLEVVN